MIRVRMVQEMERNPVNSNNSEVMSMARSLS